MINQHADITGNRISQVVSGVTIIILISACYALFMFWTSINNYQKAVNVTSTVENRLLSAQSQLNRQAQLWNAQDFGNTSRIRQERFWKAHQASLLSIQNAAIQAYADMKSASPARPYLGKFLALYGEILKQYDYQNTTVMIGDAPGQFSRIKLAAMISRANHYLDKSIDILHGRISDMTSDNRVFINNGSTASVVTLSLSLTTVLFLFAALYFRKRVLS